MPPSGASMMMGKDPGPGGPKSKEKAVDTKRTVTRLLRYFARERLLGAALIAVVVVATASNTIAPGMQSSAIDAIATGDASAFWPAAIGMLIAYLAYALLQLAQAQLSARLSVRVVRMLREELFGRVVDLPISYLDRNPHGDIMSRMTNDVENLSLTISEALPSFVSSVMTIVAIAAAMLVLSWQLALIAFAATALTTIASRLLASKIFAFSLARQTLLGRVNAITEDSLSGYDTLVAYNQQESITRTFNEASDGFTDVGIKAEAIAGVMGPVMNCINNFSFVVVAVAGALLATGSITTIGVVSAFLVYIRQFSRPINDLAMLYGQLQGALASAERVFGVLDEQPEDMSGARDFSCSRGEIDFKDVDFGYEPSTPVLESFTLNVKPGHMVALVGPTGSGKTTIVNLLERFYDVNSGSITVDGCNIEEISREALRANIAIVLQDTQLFSGTVAENLRYGKEHATDEELRRALAACNCTQFVDALPHGMDTQIDAGESLSLGQRQLLCIARAFVANPAILILDEATSNVDTRTERAIQQAMRELMRGRTSIVIAHRLSTIRDAHSIVVLDHGRIVEQGTHAELLAARGAYYELLQAQSAGFAT